MPKNTKTSYETLVNEFEEAVREHAFKGSRHPDDFDAIEADYQMAREALLSAESVIRNLRNIHSRALACHCECLGMNAENSLAVCGNYQPPYNDAAYYSVMQKWGLVNDKGEPIL